MKKSIFLLFIIIFSSLVFGLVLKGIKGNPTADSMKGIVEFSLRDRGRFMLTQNLVEKHSFKLTREQADLAAPDVGYYNGNWYELYPPGISILSIPFYLIGLHFNLSLLFTFLMGAIFALGNIVLIFLIARNIFKLSYWQSTLSGLIFAFASTSLGYNTSLFQHSETAFFIISGFYAVYKYKLNKKFGFLWGLYVWLIYGFAIFCDYPNLLLMLPVMIYFLLSSIVMSKKIEGKYTFSIRLSIIFTFLLFLSTTLLHGYYNKVNFGSWTRISGSLVGYREGIQNILDNNDTPEINKEIDSRVKDPTTFFNENKFIKGINVLLFSIDRGLFVYTPIFIFGLFGIFVSFFKKKIDLEKSILILLVVVTVFFYSSFGDPWAGFSFGPRYLIPVMPIFAIYTSYFLSRARFKILSRVTAFILIAYSSAVALVGALTTNAVPPSIEAVNLKSKYGIPFNINLIKQDKSLSIVYNSFFRSEISLTKYYIIIYSLVMLIFFIVLFILPRFEKEGTQEQYD